MKGVCFAVMYLFVMQKTSAQQNFFNVPSSDITRKHHLFFQQQFNFFSGGAQSNTTLTYGLGHDLEAGINFLGVSRVHHHFVTSDADLPYAPLVAFNVQKKFVLTNSFAIGVGSQLGWNRLGHTAAYEYANGIYKFKKTGTKIVSGLYYTSDGYAGRETRNWSDRPLHIAALRKVGMQEGIEQNLWKDRLFLQSDFISGEHSLSEVVVGGAYLVNKNWVVSAGYQIPTANSHASKAEVVELTYVP